MMREKTRQGKDRKVQLEVVEPAEAEAEARSGQKQQKRFNKKKMTMMKQTRIGFQR